jgi:hypothetical protein
VTLRVAQPLPECLEPYCGAALTRTVAERNEGYCTPHLTRHPEAWRRVRDRARVELLERQAAAIRARRKARL